MRTYLNGHWDILPLFEGQDKQSDPSGLPDATFIKGVYRVPSIFCNMYNQDDKGFFNAFNYPAEWSKTRDAWIKRTFRLEPQARGKKVFLHFGAIMGHSKIWVNGRLAGENMDPTMPIDLDISDHVRMDEPNEILVRAADIARTADGRPLYPDAGFMTKHGAGIWQDVYLEVKEPVYVSDYTYITSFRKKRVDFQVQVANATSQPRNCEVRLTLKGTAIDLKKQITVTDNTTATVTMEFGTDGINFWSAEHPNLYDMNIDITDTTGGLLDRKEERIGFKEVWIDGPDFYVNGKITHFYGDWGHRVHPYQQRPEYLRCWYRMLKDLGMNYIRMHTGPHDPIVYQIANEMGIYVCGETGLHGSFGNLATGEPEFWTNTFEHVRRFVKRDRNQVCLVMWSAGNEMRWNAPIHLTLTEHPKTKDVIKSLDPTHPVYFEGDSSLWDESAQEMISRHYGLEIAGEGWWDKSRPLHVGEMGKWHYGQPPENVMLGGNRVYERLWDTHHAIGMEAALIIERARINGVASLFPWNLTCLDNPTLPDQTVQLTWDTLEGPYPKPACVPALSSEFHWWENAEPAYRKGSSFDLLKEAFQPETVFLWERQSEYFTGSEIHRTITVINDTEDDHQYDLFLRVGTRDESRKVHVGPGGRHNLEYTFQAGDQESVVTFAVILKRDGNVVAEKTQHIAIRKKDLPPINTAIKVFGDGSLDTYFTQAGISAFRIDGLDKLSSGDLLVIEKDVIVEDAAFADALTNFIDQGGRVLLMEQVISIFKDLELKRLNVIQAHAAVDRLDGINLSWWGEQAILGSGGKHFVATVGYDKPTYGDFRSWADVGTGDFGWGGLKQSALLEMRWGKGVIIANTLELTAMCSRVPSAAQVLNRAIEYLANFRPQPHVTTQISPSLSANALLTDRIAQPISSHDAQLFILDGSQPESLDVSSLPPGSTVLVAGVTPETKAHYEKLTAVQFDLLAIPNECHGVLNARTDLTQGMSNEEFFWMNRLTYTPPDCKNLQISNGFALLSQTIQPAVSISPDRTLIEYMENYHSELFRAKVFSLFGKENRRGILLGQTLVNGRRIIFCQIRLPFAEESRSSRFWSMLLSNLRAAKPQVLLGLGQGQSQRPPYPQVLHVLKDYSNEHYDKLIHFKRNQERMDTSPELSVGTWEDIKADDGQFSLPDAGRLIVLSYVGSPRSRKFIETIGGLPNPSHTTSIELQAGGEVEVFVETKKIFSGNLKSDQARVIPEVQLDEGRNRVLVVIKGSAAGTFSMRWKTAAKKDEHELSFV